jgi:hypothetical protein
MQEVSPSEVSAHFEPTGGFDEILNGDDDLEGDLDSTLLNIVASTISKWWTLKFLRWTQLLNPFVDLDEIVYGRDCFEYYPDCILFNNIALTIPNLLAFILLQKVLTFELIA